MVGILRCDSFFPLDDGVILTGHPPCGWLSVDLYHSGYIILFHCKVSHHGTSVKVQNCLLLLVVECWLPG